MFYAIVRVAIVVLIFLIVWLDNPDDSNKK